MNYEWTLYFCLFLALWSAVVGGVFSAFSEFIMSALRNAKPAGAIESMQQINRTVIRTQFVAGIFCIAIFSVVFGLYSLKAFNGEARVALALAPLVFVPTVFLMTLLGNVPMNKKLDRLDNNSAEAEAYWPVYIHTWTRLNHVRSLGSILTAILYAGAAVTLIASAQV